MKLLSEYPLAVGEMLARAERRDARRAARTDCRRRIGAVLQALAALAFFMVVVAALAFAFVWGGERIFHRVLLP